MLLSFVNIGNATPTNVNIETTHGVVSLYRKEKRQRLIKRVPSEEVHDSKWGGKIYFPTFMGDIKTIKYGSINRLRLSDILGTNIKAVIRSTKYCSNSCIVVLSRSEKSWFCCIHHETYDWYELIKMSGNS